MSFVNLTKRASDPEVPSRSPPRPKFNHRNTNDRIREGSGRPLTLHMIGKIRKDRKSVFKELGLDEDDHDHDPYSHEKVFGELTGLSSPVDTLGRGSRFSAESDEGHSETDKSTDHSQTQGDTETETTQSPTSPSASQRPWYSRLTPGRRPKIRTTASAPPPGMSSLTRLSTIALLIAVVLPGFGYYNGREKVSVNGADAGVIQQRPRGFGPVLDTRAPSPTKVCKRWAQQTALLNGTLYIYGGQAKTTEDQLTDTWNNDFLTLDLTKSWDISTPAFRGLAQPSGPPAVANGYLWNDYNNLYLYGGLFSDKPYVEPAPESMWKYNIRSQTWTEFQRPRTSKGNHSDGGDAPVQRAAEGAGISVPELGLSWYFGGHLDLSTTPGWSNQIARVYLKSLLEFTHPGYTNDGVDSLAYNTGAGDGGVYRNITQGGLQTDAAFTERADGVLVFVPGWGEKGVLIGLGGGTADVFSESMSTLDVYDIASSQWYHQQTSGTPPSVRVNACAVIASAPDASSFNIYLYGGQNLQPYMGQTQYSDMYILTIPSFTWIKVDQSGNGPPPRAGHTCNLRDGQIIVVGGYVNATSILCESPGVFVFDASTLQWANKFNALDHAADLHPDNSVLAGSFGYKVPDIVASVIGGNEGGQATATTPAAGPATGGPFATGKPPVFTVTEAGSTATVTQWGPDATGGVPPGGGGGGEGIDFPSDSRRAGLIAAGIIAGLLGLLALYLGYCAWLYRRQVRAYKSHLALTNRYSASAASGLGGLAAFFGRRTSTREGGGNGESTIPPIPTAGLAATAAARPHRARPQHRREASASSVDSIGWTTGMVAPTEPKLFFDDEPTPESGYSSMSQSQPHHLSLTQSLSQSSQLSPARPSGWWSLHPESSTGSGVSPGSRPTPVSGTNSGSGAAVPVSDHSTGGGIAYGGSGSATMGEEAAPRRSDSGESSSSAERLLDGQEPSFFSVVMKPRRALRVVNGLEGDIEDFVEKEEREHGYTGGRGGGGSDERTRE